MYSAPTFIFHLPYLHCSEQNTRSSTNIFCYFLIFSSDFAINSLILNDLASSTVCLMTATFLCWILFSNSVVIILILSFLHFYIFSLYLLPSLLCLIFPCQSFCIRFVSCKQHIVDINYVA